MSRAAPDAIAVVGAACRFPGGIRSLAALWDALAAGRNFRAPIPLSRFDHARLAALLAARGALVPPGYGYFLADDDLTGFDPEFFGLSPREATAIDPQQRMLLELAWEALASARIAPAGLAGGEAGVFVGLSNVDYHRLQFRAVDGIGPHSGTGTSPSIAANRISYSFDLHGPSLAVDTACSSALVALDLACAALRAGTIPLALVGSANLILDPTLYVSFTQSRMLAADGLCKAFDDAADGFARGEGAGLVVLKRAADALRDGDPVLALVRGSAVNQDGQSNGLTAPSGVAQAAVIARALARAGADPARVGFVEAHGTGTALGDPIEFRALQRSFGAAGRSRPCYVGSAKTNFGHLEAAAGMLGFLKAVLAVHHRAVPPTLNLGTVNRLIALDASDLRFPARLEPWPSDEPALAAVSAFGFGGTNAHAVVEEFVPAGAPAGFDLAAPRTPFARRRLLLDLPDVGVWFDPPAGEPVAPRAVAEPPPRRAADAFCYERRWEAALPSAAPARAVRRVLVVGSAAEAAPARAAWSGEVVVLLPGGSLAEACGEGAAEIVDLRAVRLSGAAAPSAPAAVVEQACALVESFAALLRAAAALPRAERVRVDVVTRGALPAAADDLPEPAGAALAGVFQSAALELPQLVGHLIDMPQAFTAGDLARLAALDRAALAGSVQAALRAGTLLVPVLARRALGPGEPPLRPGVYAVLGGFGSLGLAAAEALAEQGARELALVGRSGSNPAARAVVDRLRAGGVAVRELRADVADPASYAALIEQLRAPGRPLRGIVHCAGRLGPVKPVLELTAPDVRAALAPKAIPALCSPAELDLFVAFSSIASSWGSRRIGAYVAANALLDAAAGRLGRNGPRALVLHWGPWAQSSMARRQAQAAEQLGRLGIAGFDPATGRALLGELLRAPAGELTVVDANWARFAPVLEGLGRGRLLAGLAPSAPGGAHPGFAPAPGRAAILAGVLAELRAVLGLAPEAELDPAAGLVDLGLDSILALELKEALEARFGLALPATLAFDHPSAAAVAELVRRSAEPDAAALRLQTLPELGGLPALDGAPDPGDLSELSEAEIRGRVERILAELES